MIKASLRRLRLLRSLRITADKKEIKDSPKLPSATSFIRKTLYEMAV
jgi:hypothetical protein